MSDVKYNWLVPKDVITDKEVISFSVHGDTNKYVIENLIPFLNYKLNFAPLNNQNTRTAHINQYVNNDNIINVIANRIYGVLDKKAVEYISNFLKYENDGCFIQRVSAPCFNVSNQKEYSEILSENIPDIINKYVPLNIFDAEDFASEFVRNNPFPFLKEAIQTASSGNDYFACDKECLTAIPILSAVTNFANKIGYFTQTNLEQRGAIKRVDLSGIQPDMPYLINFYGGAGIGKSTTAMLTTAHLKMAGLNADYINETAKRHIYEGKAYLLDGSYTNQVSLYNEQKAQIDAMYLSRSVQLSVTDSPLLLYGVYAKKGDKTTIDNFKSKIYDAFSGYNNINILLVRDPYIPYETEGRVHTLEESIKIDQEIEDALIRENIPYAIYERGNIEGICNYIISEIQKVPIIKHHVHENVHEHNDDKKETKPISKFTER